MCPWASALTLPTAYTLYGDGSTLTKILPATATVTLQSGTVKLGANNVLNTANTIILNTDATLDLNGTEYDGSLTLNGGKLTNTGNVLGTNLQQLRNLVLTADSEIEVNDGHAFHLIHSGYGVQTLTLNGHTLTKSGTGTMAWCNVSPANGTVKVMNGTLEMRSGNNGTGANNTCTLTAVTLEENGGEIQITRNYALANTVTLKGDISIASVLSGDGALNVDAGTLTLSGANTYTGGTQIAEGAKVIATSIGTGEVTGAGDIELLINATAVSVPNIVKVAYTGAATLTASGDNGAIVENTTNVTWPSGKQYIFNGGTHALTFYPGALPEDKSTETEDSASIQVKANTTLTLKARDFGGWNGSHFNNIALSVKGENAKVIAASFDTNPGCFTGRVYLADGATIQGGDNSTDAINFFGNADDANIHVTSGSASWTNKLWIGNGGGGNITNLGITVEEAASFDLSALVQNNKGIKKCGAGAMTLSGENTSTGSLIVNEGTAVITGAWAGATSVAANATLTGSGTIGGTLTFAEGATFKVEPSAANPLKVTGTISGTAAIALAETQEVISKIALIASNETIDPANFGAIPGYTYVVETVDGVHTLYAAVAAPEALTATLSGDVAWADVPWMTDESIAIDPETVDVSQVTTITLNLTTDTTLTFGDVQATFPALTTVKVNPMAENLTFTIAGDRVVLPTLSVPLCVVPMVFRSTATTLSVDAFKPLINLEYGLGMEVQFLNSCTSINFPTTYRLFGDGSVLTKQISANASGIQLAGGIVKIANSDILQSRPLFVEQGATFDLNGNTHLGSLTLNGGKLTNTGNTIGTNEQQLRNLVLTADSEIEVNDGHAFHLIHSNYDVQTLTLNGHTLIKSGTGKMQWCNVSPDGGTITVTGGILLMRAGGQAENGTDHAADTCTLTAVTLEENGGEIQITRNYALADTVTLKGDISIASVLSGDGALNVATGTTTLSGANTYMGNTTITDGATLKVTTKDALGTTRNGNGQIALGNTTLTGVGTLELAFADAEASLEMIGNGGTFTGDIIVTGGTLKFPNGSGGSGPVHGRVITVTGANAVLATGTNTDATGWSVAGRQKLILANGAEFQVNKRDTFKTPLEMTGGVVRLMAGSKQGDNYGYRAFDWYQSPTLKVNASSNATAVNPTISYITIEAVETPDVDDQTIWLRDGNLPMTILENAVLQVDARLASSGNIVKDGEGELVLAYAENTYTGTTTISAGTLTVTGATGTGATTMAVGTTLRGTGTVKGALTFTNTTETADETTTITGWPNFEIDVMSMAEPLTVSGEITGVAKLVLVGDISTRDSIPVMVSAQENVAEHFTGIPEGFTFNKVGNTHLLVNANAQGYDALYAKVSKNAKWSELTWTTDAEGTQAVTTAIAWDMVEAVTLTAEADATVTRDMTTAALASLTVADSEYTLIMAGASLDGATLTLAGDLAIAEATTLTTLTSLEGASTLKLMAGVTVKVNHTTDDTSPLSGKKVDIAEGATLVITANANRQLDDNINFSGITGTGKIVYQNANNYWMTLPKAANMFATTLEVENNLSNGLILPEAGKAFQIGSVSGSGAFRVDFNNGDPRSLEIIQSKDTTYSGGILTNNATDRLSSFYLSGIDEATLTYTGTTTVAKPLVINASGSLNLTGTWTGAMTVAGKLAGSGTINGAVTFNEGAVVVADGQALTLGTVTAESTFVEVTTAPLDTVGAAATVFTATEDFDATQFSTSAAYVLEKTSTTVDETTTYALVVKRASTVTVTGIDAFNATTQQVLSDLVIDTLKESDVTSGTYAVEVEVYTKGSETPKTPTADEVDALLGCFINVETVEVDTTANTATVKIAYEFGLADVTVDADLNVIFKALVERVDEARNDGRGLADYADGVTFSITDTLSGEVWDIADGNVEAPQDEVGAVYLMLPDTYEVEGQQRSVLTNFIGTRKFKVRVKR